MVFGFTAPVPIANIFSSVLADIFHLMDRIKVPMHHAFKKGYFVALRQSFFAWDATALNRVQDVLRAQGLSEEAMESKMYYDVKFFRDRVPRVVLPPPQLYPRVRAVFELYGSQVDPKTNKALFNAQSWKKAKNVLGVILAGYASDPPGIPMYTVRLNRIGGPAVDCYGLLLFDCLRGTNRTEDFHNHKQLIEAFGSWCTGVEMDDCLLDIRSGRFNQDIAVIRRLGHPRLGHYDLWLIDELQLLVEKNHGVLLYPEWSNASDYITTPERFGTVCLHSPALHKAVNDIEVNWEKVNLTSDQRYLCKVMGTQLPMLPVVSEEEQRLFCLLAVQSDPIDWEQMAIQWCKFVKPESNIFPKLPIYLRTYYKTYEKNQRVKEAVKVACTGEQKLKAINAQTMNAYVSTAVQSQIPVERLPPPCTEVCVCERVCACVCVKVRVKVRVYVCLPWAMDYAVMQTCARTLLLLNRVQLVVYLSTCVHALSVCPPP